MKHTIFAFALLAACAASLSAYSGQPYFQPGEDPRPDGMVWQRVEELSDEFDGDSLDLSKWQAEPEANGWRWYGRPPGLFRASNVTVAEGQLQVTVSKLEEPVVKGGHTFTHQGAIVRSLHPGHVGWYFECRMKANATVMSSTFWLMTKNSTGKRLETDIQECVGRTTELTEKWGKNWDEIFHSNLIHRVSNTNPEKVQLQGHIKTPTKNHERFYVYGAWWKSPEEVQFFLDGKYAYSIRPQVAWDVPAYIQMAVEVYDWNPVPEKDCLIETGTRDQRTTRYDWVRVWKLVPAEADASP
ncbi:hypothetical protein JCM19992_21280 [Thermostilla marina]